VLQLVIDSLRYWVTAFGIDGFRFDLATTLGREEHGFDPNGGFFDALRQDPLLKTVKLIAEPWDVGPGGYQPGGFPHPFAEWNDAFRDGTRRFWKGETGAADIAQALLGSARRFDHGGRPGWASINFITAHDGFTLADLTAYNEKHNEANGENNADGHNGSHSDNMGAEGPTDDEAINRRRALRRRNMLATLFLSQGTPMLLSGDEIGNSKSGNNNAYSQDNPLGWVNWGAADEELRAFTRKLIAFRKAHPVFTQKPFLHGKTSPVDGKPDVTWATMEGTPPHWEDAGFQAFVLTMAIAGDAPDYAQCDERLIMVVNGSDRDAVFTLAEPAEGMGWERGIDTADPAPDQPPVVYGGFPLFLAHSVVVFSPVRTGDTPA
jgi:glycogen operon protein